MRFGRVPRGLRGRLTELPRLLGQNLHLRLHVFALYLDDFRQVPGVHKPMGEVEGGRDVLLSKRHGTLAEVFGALANSGGATLERGGGAMGGRHERVERSACLLDASFSKCMHIGWNFKVCFVGHFLTPWVPVAPDQ